jgi:glycosyltransferase involved in cell wall biosynthesis
LLVADGKAEIAAAVLEVLAGNRPGLGQAARRSVKRNYAWEKSCRRLVRLIEGGADSQTALPEAHGRALS